MPMPPIELLLPALVVAVGFLGYCFFDLYRIEEARYLPKWAWAIICSASIPLGGILYLLLGRGQRAHV